MATLYCIRGAEGHEWDGALFETEREAEMCLADIIVAGHDDAWIDLVSYYGRGEWEDFREGEDK